MKNNESDLVSIILVCLNEGKRLPAILDSIVASSYSNIEIIVNDDPRTSDNTGAVLESYEDKLAINHIIENKNLGYGRLQGAKAGKGKYLFFLDADMQITKDLITECVEKIKNGADGIYIPEEVIGQGFWTRCKWLEKKCYFGDEQTSSPRFFSTSSYFLSGGHNPSLALSEDKDLDIKFKKANLKLVWSQNFLYHNEGKITPKKTFKSKFFWSQTGFEFLNAQPTGALKQFFFIFFRKAYFRNYKLLLSHPLLTVGMFILKLAEVLGASIGGIGTKLKILKKQSYKTNGKI